MKVIIFGASGMVGQGVLRECVNSPDVESILTVLRSPMGGGQPKVKELLHKDFFDFSALSPHFKDYDACFFCLGVSSAGMTEKEYHRLTFDITLAAAKVLSASSPKMTFIYVSGAGTDSSEKGSTMWARVKGSTENALMKLPFRDAYMFRPGYIQPMHGIQSKTALYRIIYQISSPIFPILNKIAPNLVTTTERVGKAMLVIVKNGSKSKILENREINTLAATDVP